MKQYITFVIFIFASVQLFAQEADAISGETLRAEQLELYLHNDSLKALYNNDPFDNISVTTLKGDVPEVAGEILNPGKASTDRLLLRTVIVKELVPDQNGSEPEFRGAFQYYGYSLADLIKDFVVSKSNSKEFGLTTDMYVTVEGKDGSMSVFSWGELFFSTTGQDIIFATAVQPVFPTHDDDTWAIPSVTRIIAANDYLSVRNIEEPVLLRIGSFGKTFPGHKGLRPLYSGEINVSGPKKSFVIRDQQCIDLNTTAYNTLFYGMHKGSRGRRRFEGTPLADVLREDYDFDINDLQNGIIVFGARDAYRALFSLSEILNRTDMAETLLVDVGNDEDGRFIIRPGSDFFADRHLKGASQGYIEILRKR